MCEHIRHDIFASKHHVTYIILQVAVIDVVCLLVVSVAPFVTCKRRLHTLFASIHYATYIIRQDAVLARVCLIFLHVARIIKSRLGGHQTCALLSTTLEIGVVIEETTFLVNSPAARYGSYYEVDVCLH